MCCLTYFILLVAGITATHDSDMKPCHFQQVNLALSPLTNLPKTICRLKQNQSEGLII